MPEEIITPQMALVAREKAVAEMCTQIAALARACRALVQEELKHSKQQQEPASG